MKNQEGVIKYQLSHQDIAIKENISIASINAWRTLFFKLELIGQIEGRYDGYGFGNISQRLNNVCLQNQQFVISGTQTGGIECLSRQHYCTVLKANPYTNTLTSTGQTKPSSEALTHASVYLQSNAIKSVIHVHSPDIWINSRELKIPCVSADIEYGTPEMAKAVESLFDTASLQNTAVFSMLGHQDGIVAFSDSTEKAAVLLIELLSMAMEIEQNKE